MKTRLLTLALLSLFGILSCADPLPIWRNKTSRSLQKHLKSWVQAT